MLSILIPTYKYCTLDLVNELHSQGIQCAISFEIICFDDGSRSELNLENERINDLPYACFETLNENVGLSQNRNLLATKAQYHHLLFIDGDSKICNENFISNYIRMLPYDGVIYGGRKHPEKCPSKSQKLRWKYGILKEDKTSKERVKKPYEGLLFNNALLNKKSFNAIKFDKEISKYGHEDTLFAFQTKNHKIPLQHIDNPVLHNDIDTNSIYIQKTRSALRNLHMLYVENKITPGFVKLLRYFNFLKIYYLDSLFAFFFELFEKLIVKNLLSNHPSLFLFDLFKLGYICKLNQNK